MEKQRNYYIQNNSPKEGKSWRIFVTDIRDYYKVYQYGNYGCIWKMEAKREGSYFLCEGSCSFSPISIKINFILAQWILMPVTLKYEFTCSLRSLVLAWWYVLNQQTLQKQIWCARILGFCFRVLWNIFFLPVICFCLVFC